jgi:hypothetical protein
MRFVTIALLIAALAAFMSGCKSVSTGEVTATGPRIKPNEAVAIGKVVGSTPTESRKIAKVVNDVATAVESGDVGKVLTVVEKTAPEPYSLYVGAGLAALAIAGAVIRGIRDDKQYHENLKASINKEVTK